MSRFVTVHSDGTGRGTVILDEDGKQIAGVTELNFSIEADGVTHGSIEVRGVHANVSGVAIEEVNFTCPLCGDMTEHKCDTQLGGGSPTIQHASLQFMPIPTGPVPPPNPGSWASGPVIPAQGMRVSKILDYDPCWEEMVERKINTGEKRYHCYVNSLIQHDVHVDTKEGVNWRDASTLRQGLSPL